MNLLVRQDVSRAHEIGVGVLKVIEEMKSTGVDRMELDDFLKKYYPNMRKSAVDYTPPSEENSAQDDDTIIMVDGHPLGLQIQRGDIIINPDEVARSVPYRLIDKATARRELERGLSRINTHHSETPNLRV